MSDKDLVPAICHFYLLLSFPCPQEASLRIIRTSLLSALPLSMSVDYLNTNEKARLTDVIFDPGLSFAAAEKKFKESIPTSRCVAALHQLRLICKELVASSDGAALITSLYLADGMRKADCSPAKVLFYDILVELEYAIRKDMFYGEQIKCQSKDSKEGKKSGEAIHAEWYRMHCAAKVFAFDLLAGAVSGDDKATAYVSKKQDVIEAALERWEKSSADIKEALLDTSQCWAADRDKQRCGTLMGCGAVFDQQPNKRAAAVLRTAPSKIPSLPVFTGELQYLLPGQRSFVLFDGEAPSPDWLTVKALLDQATAGPLSKGDRESLIFSLTDRVTQRAGVNNNVVRALTEHNPEVCAAVLSKLPQSTSGAYIQNLLQSDVRVEKIEVVMLHTPKSLEQKNVRLFISSRLEQFLNKASLSASEKESLKEFVLFLHQLVTKASRENKEIYIADPLKSELSALVQASGAPDIVSRWDEIK